MVTTELVTNALRSKILTYHVVGQRLTPEQLENGSFERPSRRA